MSRDDRTGHVYARAREGYIYREREREQARERPVPPRLSFCPKPQLSVVVPPGE